MDKINHISIQVPKWVPGASAGAPIRKKVPDEFQEKHKDFVHSFCS